MRLLEVAFNSDVGLPMQLPRSKGLAASGALIVNGVPASESNHKQVRSDSE